MPPTLGTVRRQPRGRAMMYLRMTRFRMDPSAYDRVMALTQDVIDAVKQQPGNQGTYMGGDSRSGNGAIVTLWDTKAHAELDRAKLGDIVPRIQDMGVRLDPPDIYEVTGQSYPTPIHAQRRITHTAPGDA